MSFDLFTYLSSLAFIYVYGRLAIHFAPVIFSYFLNSPTALLKKEDKPRFLFHLTGLSLMHLMFSFKGMILESNFLLLFLTLTVFSLGAFFCHISWTMKFKSSFVPPRKKTLEKSCKNFNFSISDSQLFQLYNELVKFDLLKQDLTSSQDFKNALLKDWNEHNSKLHLKMDGPSCREFYEYLVKTFPNNTMTLKNLISSKLFIRPDGKFYKYNTLKNAPTKTLNSKNYKEMQQIFDKIGSII